MIEKLNCDEGYGVSGGISTKGGNITYTNVSGKEEPAPGNDFRYALTADRSVFLRDGMLYWNENGKYKREKLENMNLDWAKGKLSQIGNGYLQEEEIQKIVNSFENEYE